jgi:transposase
MLSLITTSLGVVHNDNTQVYRQKVRGRDWRCRSCGFTGHRDVVGAVNMFPLAFGTKVTFPSSQDVTYLQPGPVRRARRAVVAQDTGPAAGNRRRRFSDDRESDIRRRGA